MSTLHLPKGKVYSPKKKQISVCTPLPRHGHAAVSSFYDQFRKKIRPASSPIRAEKARVGNARSSLTADMRKMLPISGKSPLLDGQGLQTPVTGLPSFDALLATGIHKLVRKISVIDSSRLKPIHEHRSRLFPGDKGWHSPQDRKSSRLIRDSVNKDEIFERLRQLFKRRK